MHLLNVSCPHDLWPQSFSGCVALGITDLPSDAKATLWVVFEIKSGALVSAYGTLGDGKEVPGSVHKKLPAITGRASSNLWSLLIKNRRDFVKLVQEGGLHIEGDYRVFGRYSLALLQAAQKTDLWTNLPSIFDEVVAKNSR